MYPIRKRQPKKCSCPVCRTYLGLQEINEYMKFHCDECKTWFTYLPGIRKPISKLDRDTPNPCKCVSCINRIKP